MNELALSLYLISVLSALDCALGLLTCLVGLAVAASTAMAVCFTCSSYVLDTSEKQLFALSKTCSKWGGCLFSLFLLVIILIPAERTMYMMLGVTAVDEIVQTEEGQKVRTLLNQKLDELLEDDDDQQTNS